MLRLFEYLVPFSAILCLSVFMITQILLVRYCRDIGFFKSVIIGFFSGLILLVTIEVFSILFLSVHLIDIVFLAIVNVTTYSFLGLGYFSFINVAVSALRIRLLTELENNPCGLTLKEILARYNAKEIVNRRIRKLENNGQIVFIRGRYFLRKSVTLLMIIILEYLRVIILNRKIRISLKQLIQYKPPKPG